jgi:SP family sugar:H+ symporter-like MFS transporter
MVIVFFFVIESKDRTLEEIDLMYINKVNPIKSASWTKADIKANLREGREEESSA